MRCLPPQDHKSFRPSELCAPEYLCVLALVYFYLLIRLMGIVIYYLFRTGELI